MPDATGMLQKVTFNRRFFGTFLLELGFYAITLGVGWYVWLAFTAGTSQTPAKRAVDVYTLDRESGKAITSGRVWVREVLVKQLASWLLSAAVLILVDGLWVIFDKNRQALHDKIVGTVVVYAPNGLPEPLKRGLAMADVAVPGVKGTADELRELAKLHQEGILTDEEYEAKRRHLAERM